MGNGSNSRILRAFAASLTEEERGRLKGFENFLSRVPRLASKLIESYGGIVTGYKFDPDFDVRLRGNELRVGEVNSRLDYQGFSFYWGKKDSSLTTRMVNPPEGVISAADLQREILGEMLGKKTYLDRMNSESKFEAGKVDKVDGLGAYVIVSTALRNPRDAVKGDVLSYWNSYWYSTMLPLVAFIQAFKDKEKAASADLARNGS
jgi:hypothetical protein